MPHQNHEVAILLGVWGEKFIKDFLQLSLASLLAPGNIPAMSQQYKTRFVFLTRSYDVEIFESELAFQELKKYCTIEFIPINDLIILSNYSTTLTLAYDRAIKQAGLAMLNTYFIFLTADYIFADGSFRGLMRYMQQGYSGIQAGNFQVAQEEIESDLINMIDRKNHILQISPRELLKKSLPHLHPVSLASRVDQAIVHNYFANRFFVQNESALAGKFYLLHMLCIKPETTDYQVRASCDYSFIPEMCPSGNIATITDSDDYLVIEIQSLQHELQYIRWGAYELPKLAKAFMQWTTAHHRQNATKTIYYHIDDLSITDKQLLETQLNKFIEPLNALVNTKPPQPFRNHPYWVIQDRLMSQETEVKRLTTASFDISPLQHQSKFRKMLQRIYGMPPNVFRWHYRYKEYKSIQQQLMRFIGDTSPDKIIVFYDTYQLLNLQYAAWLMTDHHINQHYHTQCLSPSSTTLNKIAPGSLKKCLFFVKASQTSAAKPYLEKIKSLLTSDSELLLILTNENPHLPNMVYNFKNEFSKKMNFIFNSPFNIAQVTTINESSTYIGTAIIDAIEQKYSYNRHLRFFMYCLVGAPGTVIYWIKNNFLTRSLLNKSGRCLNIFVTLTPKTNEPKL